MPRLISSKRLIPLIILFILAAPVFANHQTDTTDISSQKDFIRFIDDIIDRVEQQVLRQIGIGSDDAEAKQNGMQFSFDGQKGAIHFSGDVLIDERDRIEGNIVVRNGNLTVRGIIRGDVLVLNGDVFVESTGRIEGSVTAVNGTVRLVNGVVTGSIEEKEGVDIDEEYTYRRKRPTRTAHYQLTNLLQQDLLVRDIELDNFWMGYNRVEGISIGLGSRKNLYFDGSMNLSLYGKVGYAFKIHRWRALLGGTRQFNLSDRNLLEFGGEIYTLTESKEDWIIGRTENDLAAFFFHQDHRDYYDRQGFSLYAGNYFNTSSISMHVRAQYLNEQHESLENKTDWALFVKDRSFRVNPPIDEGNLRAIRIGINASSVERTHHLRDREGWSLLTSLEFSSPDLGGDFDYTQFIVDARRYQPLSKYDNLNVRVRVGTAENELPLQRMYEIGGLGTLPAYRFKEFQGNRMFLLNTEYVLGGSVIDQLRFLPRGFLGGLSLLLFLDTGWASMASPSDGLFQGFSDLSFNNLKTSIGLGVGSTDGRARLGFAWRTDKRSSPVVFFRISHPF